MAYVHGPGDGLRKKQLVALGARLGLGSKAALDVHHIEELRQKVNKAAADRK